MRQFDVLANPIPRARRVLSFVMILQSDLVETDRDRVIAPLAPSAAMPSLAGRLIPIVMVSESAYAVLVPFLTTMPAADLRQAVENLEHDRDRIIAALDYLFLGF
jgi:hypothetical protein